MNVQDLLAYHQQLGAMLASDPVLGLASAVVRFDPVCLFDEDWFDYSPDIADSDDQLRHALAITRACLIDLYVDAVQKLHSGADAERVVHDIVAAITAEGIPIDEPEQLWCGIPIPAYGTRLSDPDWLRSQPDLLPVLAFFGVGLRHEGEAVEAAEDAQDVGLVLMSSLETYEDETSLQELAACLAWIWGLSGNSAVDLDDDTMMELQPLDWTPNNLELAREIIREADELLAQAGRGLKRLNADKLLRETLRGNIAIVRSELRGKDAFYVLRGSPTPNPFRLVWPAFGAGNC